MRVNKHLNPNLNSGGCSTQVPSSYRADDSSDSTMVGVWLVQFKPGATKGLQSRSGDLLLHRGPQVMATRATELPSRSDC